MSKLRLDYFLSVGGKLVAGDVFIDLFSRRAAVGEFVSSDKVNGACPRDSKRFVESFAPRKNEGVMPCDGGFPVVGHCFADGTDDNSAGRAKHFDWEVERRDSFELEFWQPDLAVLIKMQDEHDATLSKTETVQPKPSVYTQAMADNGELPAVGMEFLAANGDPNSRLSDFNGKVVSVLSVCKHDGRDVITFSHQVMGIGCGCYCASWIRPIDTRTEKEKVIDGIIYDIEDRINNCDDAKDAAKEIYSQYIK